MKTNQEILDDFGKVLVQTAFDLNYRILKSNLKREEKFDDLELKLVSKEILESVFFDFLKVFEENKEFKLYYEKDNQRVNLEEISEMLKAEPIIENGWIERYSEVFKK